MTYVMTRDELYHHGILGQKWGVRRFQNTDGSYTSEGKKRYGRELGKKAYRALSSDKAQKVLRGFAKATEPLRDPNNFAKKDGYDPKTNFAPKNSWGERHKQKLEKEQNDRKNKVLTPKELENRRKAMKRAVAAGSAVLATAAMAGYLQSKIDKERMKQASGLSQQLAAEMFAKYGSYPAGGGLLLMDDIYNPLPVYKKTIKL